MSRSVYRRVGEIRHILPIPSKQKPKGLKSLAQRLQFTVSEKSGNNQEGI